VAILGSRRKSHDEGKFRCQQEGGKERSSANGEMEIRGNLARLETRLSYLVKKKNMQVDMMHDGERREEEEEGEVALEVRERGAPTDIQRASA